MLSKVKQFCSVKQKLLNLNKFYCSDKVKTLQEAIEKDKKTKTLQESSDVIVESYEECAKFEEKVLKQILVEKEHDAALQSRLSKECKTLFTTPANKQGGGKSGPLLHLDRITIQNDPDCPDMGNYSFENFQSKLPAISVTAKCLKDPENKGHPGPVTKEGTSGPVIKEGTSGPVKNELPPSGGAGGGSGLDITGGPRPVRQEPGKVLFCFVPEEWWRMFIPKTGVTGFGTFLFSFSTFLVSKEYYVLEHSYYHGLGALFVWIGGIKYVGPHLKKYLDKELNQYETAWNEGRVNEKKVLEDDINHELLLQFQSEGQVQLLDAKRENVHLQLEEEFRKRQMMVYKTVKQRLDYHVALELVKARIQQKNLVEYVTREVKKAITPEMQDKLIYYSIDKIVNDLNQQKK